VAVPLTRLSTSGAHLAGTRMTAGASIAFCSWDVHEKLVAIRASEISAMPYVPHMPAVSSVHPLLPVMLWIPLALLTAAGIAPRTVGGVLGTSMAFVLLADQRTYSNHLYLLVLIVLLLSLMPSSRQQETFHAWPAVLLKCQASVLYGFGALAKLTPAYLTGWMVAGTLDRNWWSWIPQWEAAPLLFAAVALLSILVEAWIAFALWSARFRQSAVVLGVGLHLGCILVLRDVKLDLIVFGLASLSLYPMFLLRLPLSKHSQA
jgi:Vitamin K-dependent gamma-carboxylase